MYRLYWLRDLVAFTATKQKNFRSVDYYLNDLDLSFTSFLQPLLFIYIQGGPRQKCRMSRLPYETQHLFC